MTKDKEQREEVTYDLTEEGVQAFSDSSYKAGYLRALEEVNNEILKIGLSLSNDALIKIGTILSNLNSLQHELKEQQK